jgi:hypothetical protein
MRQVGTVASTLHHEVVHLFDAAQLYFPCVFYHPHTLLFLFAGRPLPPLFNWLPGELDEVPDDIVRKLQPKTA